MGNYIQYPVMNHNGIFKKNVCICTTESPRCAVETNTTLWINYTSIKKRNRTRRDPKPLLAGICCKEHSWLMGPAPTPSDPLSHLHWGRSVPTQLPANDRAQQGCCIWPIPAQGGSLSAWGPSVHQLRLSQNHGLKLFSPCCSQRNSDSIMVQGCSPPPPVLPPHLIS